MASAAVARWGWRVARAATIMWTAALFVGLLDYDLAALWCAAGLAASLWLERWWRRQ